jgi:hypothetical protein
MPSAYRDGVAFARGGVEDGWRRAGKRRAAIDAAAWKRLPACIRLEIEVLEDAAALPLDSMEAIAGAEERLRRYEAAVEVALLLVEIEHATRAERRARRRISGPLLLSAAVLGASAPLIPSAYAALEGQERYEAGRAPVARPPWFHAMGPREAAACAEVCKKEGRCTLHDGDCIAVENVDCAFSEACADRGACAAHRNRCVARADYHCLESAVCERAGRCHAELGVCVASEPPLASPEP